jgi:chromate transporter
MGEHRRRLGELARLFLRLGATAFGGPAVHIALFEQEVVRRRGWLSREAFLDLLAATNLIPGPNSTEMALHVGRLRAGLSGLVVAGLSFILPAALATCALAWGYVRYGALPEARGLLSGLLPVLLVIVLVALRGLGESALKERRSWLVATTSLALVLAGVPELAVLLVGGVTMLVLRRPAAFSGLNAVSSPAASTLFWSFTKIGSVLYGSGYVLMALLRAELVDRLHLATERQVLDAVAAGQLTPGPVFTTATFLGFVLEGPTGALVATVGIFLPAFVLVAVSGPLVPRLRASPMVAPFLDGVVAASLALMVPVVWTLASRAIVSVPTAFIGLVSAWGVAWKRWPSTPLMIAGGLLGLLLGLLLGR